MGFPASFAPDRRWRQQSRTSRWGQVPDMTRTTSSTSADPPIDVVTHRVRPRVAIQILLDPGVPVERVDVDLGAVGDNLGLVLATCLGAAAFAAFEDQLDQLRAADVEVVGDQGLEEPRAWRGTSNTRVREVSIWRIDSSHQ